ncbi:signal peptidase I [Candidatus Woesearchaeota archaeon]|nr:signal peptidase I [Candidatus Woesearchaeota archaeon]
MISNKIKKVWNFIWNDDSIWSWIVNIILAFILVKFLIYPGLGFFLGTTHPVVAVVSGSMEHNGIGFQDWWELNKEQYEDFNITKKEFLSYNFVNGFNKGDLIVLLGEDEINRGDVIVFWGSDGQPIIHRTIINETNGLFFVQTKGDNNRLSRLDEVNITKDRIIGTAKYRVPYLGWFKILFLNLIGVDV